MQTIHIANATFHVSGALPAGLLQLPVLTKGAAAMPNALAALGDYLPGQGGILVATIPAMLGMPARHLLASKTEAHLQWGGYNEETPGAASHVDGIANTHALLADRHDHPAAAFCAKHEADGHTDFFLPSRFDLLMAYLMSPATFEKEGWYWSSTQVSRNYAFVQAFANGSSGWNGKTNEWRVRPFRQILVTA